MGARRPTAGVLSRRQLLELGISSDAVQKRIRSGRLHPVWRGVYALGRPQLTHRGRWMAAVLACGPDAALSHESAAALWGIRAAGNGAIHVSVPARVDRRHSGITVHRRLHLGPKELRRVDQVAVTSLLRTLADLATRLHTEDLEATINKADRLELLDPETLRAGLAERKGQHGVARLSRVLDRSTFTLTDSALERRFLRLARRAGLPQPQTGRRLNGFKVDFFWHELGLVIETDGLRYHRTPAQQVRDRLRDQAHTAAGLTPLRFTHAQVTYEPDYVRATLRATAARLPTPHANS